MCNFHYLGYYCSPNLSIHQNSTQEPTWNFLATLMQTLLNSEIAVLEINRPFDLTHNLVMIRFAGVMQDITSRFLDVPCPYSSHISTI